jgi:exonuclease III
VQQQSYHPIPLSTTLLEATLQIAPDQHLHVYGVHLAAQPFVLFEMWRWLEIKTVLHRIKSYPSRLCLIGGDFNAIAPGDPVNVSAWPSSLRWMLAWQGGRVLRWTISEVMAAGLTDCFRSLYPKKDGFTLPTPAPNSRLDYLFVNKALRAQLTECCVVRDPQAVTQASDHFPLMAKFS